MFVENSVLWRNACLVLINVCVAFLYAEITENATKRKIKENIIFIQLISPDTPLQLLSNMSSFGSIQ